MRKLDDLFASCIRIRVEAGDVSWAERPVIVYNILFSVAGISVRQRRLCARITNFRNITDKRTNINNWLQQNGRSNSPRADNYILEKKKIILQQTQQRTNTHNKRPPTWQITRIFTDPFWPTTNRSSHTSSHNVWATDPRSELLTPALSTPHLTMWETLPLQRISVSIR